MDTVARTLAGPVEGREVTVREDPFPESRLLWEGVR